MRVSPLRRHRQRAQLDAKLANIRAGLEAAALPRGGWLKAVRESLGMSAEQLGARLGISKQNALKLERNELRKTVSLESLQRAADALDCRLVYALVPRQTLESRVDERAHALARRELARVQHSMALE